MKLLKEIKGVFKQPKKSFYLGRIAYGTPYFYPWNFNQSILTIRKEKPRFLRCKSFNLFGYSISYGLPVYIYWHGLGWKDKYNLPRFEWAPSFYIFFFRWQFCIHWNAPDDNNYQYYEQILWWVYYANKDIKAAKETWSWIDCNTKKSSWNDNYLI